MIITCITSGMDALCLYILLKVKSMKIPYLCMTGFSLACLLVDVFHFQNLIILVNYLFSSFIFGIIGFFSGLSWVMQFDKEFFW